MLNSDDLTIKLTSFFEHGPMAKKAAHSLKDGREIQLLVANSPFRFFKENKNNRIEAGNCASPDIIFEISALACEELVTRDFKTVGEVGIFIFEKMITNDPAHKVKAKVRAGVISLVMGGYLGILGEGGAEVAKYLAQKGLTNPSKIKDAIAKLRS